MDRRLRTNLVLAAALVALGLVIWLAPQREKEGPGVPVFAPGESISRIEVLEGGEPLFALKLDDGTWRMTSPFALPASRFQVETLLNALRQTAVRKYPLEGLNLAEFGLAPARWTVQVNGFELAVGGRTALGNNRYLRKGDSIYLVSEMLAVLLQRNPLDYLDKRLLSETAQISAITLPSGVRVEKSGNSWQLEPENDAVPTDALQRLVDAWRNASAMNVNAASSVPRDGEVRIEFADGSSLRFGVEVRETELVLSRDAPAVSYVLPRDAANAMLLPGAAVDPGRVESEAH